MRNYRNQEGYVLLLVMFLIVVVSIISAVFIRGSISNAIQEKNVDARHLTVTTAEAGIDYYKTSLLNRFYESVEDLDYIASTEISRQQQEIINKKRTSIDYKQVERLVSNELNNRLNQVIQNIDKNNSEQIHEKYEFKISKQPNFQYLTVNADNIVFQANVTGINKIEKLSKLLQLKIIFSLKDYSGQTNSSASTDKINIYNLYPDDSLVPACGSSKDIKNEMCKANRNENYEQIKNHSIVYFPKGYVKSNANIDMKNNTKIYAQASSADGQIGFEAGNLVVKNSSLFTYTYTGSLFTQGGFKAKGLEVKNSGKFFINAPSLNITGESEFKNNSTVVMRTSGRFFSDLSIKNSTTVCVDGALTIDGKFELENNSKIYIYGVLNKQPSGNGKVIPVGPTDVYNYCSISSNENSEWPKPALDVKYN